MNNILLLLMFSFATLSPWSDKVIGSPATLEPMGKGVLIAARSRPYKQVKKKQTKKTTTYNSQRYTMGVAGNAGVSYFGLGLGLGLGLEGWYHISKTMHLGLSWTNVRNENSSAEIGGSTFYEKLVSQITTINAYFRYLVWRSVAITASIGSTQVNGTWGYKNDQAADQNTLIGYKDQMLVANFAVGNHWQSSGGYLFGIDWLGLSFILDQNVSLGEVQQGKTLQDLNDRSIFLVNRTAEKQIETRMSESIQWYALVLRLGYAF